MTVKTTDNFEALKREMILSAEEDYVDLASYVREVAETLDIHSEDRARESTLQIITELLEDGLIRPGIPTSDGGFEPWEEHTVETVARIDSEWRQRGRAPELGDIVWFEATEAGESFVDSLTTH